MSAVLGSQLSGWKSILDTLRSGGRLRFSNLQGSAKAFFLYGLQRSLGRPLLVVTPRPEESEILWRDLNFFAPPQSSDGPPLAAQGTAIQYPAWDVLPEEYLSPSRRIRLERLRGLERIRRGSARFLVVPLEALRQKLFPRELYEEAVFDLSAGEEIFREDLLDHLQRLGYRAADPVETAGDFRSHGGILDLFSPLYSYPIRIEFFGDRIESLRFFDQENQKSLCPADRVRLIPVQEALLLKETVEKARAAVRELSRSDPAAAHKASLLRDGLERLEFFPGIESLGSFLYPHEDSLLAFFPQPPVVVLDEAQEIGEMENKFWRELSEVARERKSREPFLPAPEALYFRLEEVLSESSSPRVELSALNLSGDPDYAPFPFAVEAVTPYRSRLREFISELKSRYGRGDRIVLAAPAGARRKRLAALLQENDLNTPSFQSFEQLVRAEKEELPLPDRPLSLCLGELSTGFSMPGLGLVLLGDDDIFHAGPPARKVRSAGVSERRAFLHDFRDLNVGDFIVHLSYGIGRYLGLKTLETRGITADFLEIEYADHDKLYLPMDTINMVQKYRGAGAGPPRLDKLGSTSWEGVKKRVKKALKEMAEDLLKLYARRQIASTTPFSRGTQWHQEFAASFEYQETEDQQRAIDEVRQDMEQARPMDRLVCGDVGYGKTEVAIRAAFKAAYDGRQVAVVVPTTLLAQQHHQTFSSRFASYPISVDVISRFRSPREQKEILSRLREGKLDIVIGTHRLLQRDVTFKNLGLVVIDEEQRFGVTHKERLKKFREAVDVLTLTATPIPRTLQMSLVGLRDLSVIDTPPADRLAIRTQIRRFSEPVIRQAVNDEIARGGQVFFVHNRVETIHSMERYLRRLLPGIRLAVAHGQMSERTLEKVMVQFLEHQVDLLLCSTIIESGLDIPSANTIIINRADRMGLSQLYQLRGRVGRDRFQAQAYLLVPGEDLLSATAKKRLQAILELSTLGSGFRLAMRDLEIRGGGNLLGAQQSGHIAAVGFDLYCKLLEEAVAELKGETVPEKIETKVALNAEGYIPRAYLPDPKERLMVYKRIYSVPDLNRLCELEREFQDRFGEIPPPVERLMQTAGIRIMAAALGIVRVERSNQHLSLTFHKLTPVSPARVIQMARDDSRLHFVGEDTLSLNLSGSRWESVFPEVKNLLQRLESCATLPAS